MATSTIQSPNMLDISNEFTYALPDGQHSITAFYFPSSKVVIASLYVYGASAFATSTKMFNIPSTYTPVNSGHTSQGTNQWKCGGSVQTATGVYPATIVAAENGIYQQFSSTATGASGTVMWRTQ